MNLSTTVLGSYAVHRLQALSGEFILQIGTDRLTRAELAGVGCYNFVAAKLLSQALRAAGVKSLAQLYADLPPAALALPRVGVVSLAVLGAAFEAKGIGGGSPLETWARKHTDAKLVMFHTLKVREEVERARERKQRRARKAQRRDQAHELRLERHERRTAGAT